MHKTDTYSKIGTWTSTSLALGNMIGSGIFLLPAALAAYGGISLIGWCHFCGGGIDARKNICILE